jgi:hypothetical protein
MHKYIIKHYIDKLRLIDVKNFISDNNYNVTDDELHIIYNTIKNDWYKLLYGDYKSVFNKIKSHFNKDTYNNMIELYHYYKNKYKSYL